MSFSRQKKISILIIAAGVFVAGVIFVVKNKKAISELGFPFFAASPTQTADQNDEDPDNDGLSNWEEKMYKTDPYNPDSDGDGYLDGEEVMSGYDPLKKAPDDKLPGALEPRPNLKNLSKLLSLNLAQLLGQKIQEKSNTSILGLTEENLLPEPEEITNKILSEENLNIIFNLSLQDLKLSPIPDQELKIINDNSKEAAQIYTNQISAILKEGPNLEEKFNQSFLETLSMALETKEFSRLKEYLVKYENAYEKIRQAPVPYGLVGIDKKMLSLTQTQINIIKAIIQTDEDPLKAGIALKVLPLVYEETLNLIQEIRSTLQKVL